MIDCKQMAVIRYNFSKLLTKLATNLMGDQQVVHLRSATYRKTNPIGIWVNNSKVIKIIEQPPVTEDNLRDRVLYLTRNFNQICSLSIFLSVCLSMIDAMNAYK